MNVYWCVCIHIYVHTYICSYTHINLPSNTVNITPLLYKYNTHHTTNAIHLTPTHKYNKYHATTEKVNCQCVHVRACACVLICVYINVYIYRHMFSFTYIYTHIYNIYLTPQKKSAATNPAASSHSICLPVRARAQSCHEPKLIRRRLATRCLQLLPLRLSRW